MDFDFFNGAHAIYTYIALFAFVLLATDVLGMLFGVGLSGLLDSVDIDFGDFNISGLGLPKVPFGLLLYFGLFGFSFSGLVAQFFWFDGFGSYLPGYLLLIPGLIGLYFSWNNPVLRWVEKLDTSSSYNLEDDIIGSSVKIVLSYAAENHPTQALFCSKENGDFKVMVEPANPKDVFDKGSSAIVIAKHGSKEVFLITKEHAEENVA